MTEAVKLNCWPMSGNSKFLLCGIWGFEKVHHNFFKTLCIAMKQKTLPEKEGLGEIHVKRFG